VSACQVRDPTFDETCVLQPIITPITTTDEVLGQDKRKIQIYVGPKNMNATHLRSAKLLNKFWGEEQDTDATDGTVDHDTDSELHKALKYLVSPHEKKGKEGDPRRKRAPKIVLLTKCKGSLITRILSLVLILSTPDHKLAAKHKKKKHYSMKCLYWNIRGNGNLETQIHLCHMIKSHKPDFLFLAEPIVSFHTIPAWFWKKLNLHNNVVNNNNNTPSLWCLWNNQFDITILLNNEQCIAFKYFEEGTPTYIVAIHASTSIHSCKR